MDYEFIPPYYSTPCQVKYWDGEKNCYVGGVAFRNWIISGETGKLLYTDQYIDSVVAKYNKDIEDVVIELDPWLDISEEILGY